MGVHDGGFGLAGMRERMRALGGSLDIVGKPGIGTEVRAVVPVRHRVHADSP
jgi:signal transduction histidine kinase